MKTKQLNILFVLENYYPHIGGVENLFKNLCEGLVKRGHCITVITRLLPKTKREEKIGGVHIVRVPCFDNRYLFTFAALPKVWRYTKNADIISTTTFNAAPPAWLAGKLRNKPVLITVHETWIGKWRQYTNFSWPKMMLHEVLERIVFLPTYDSYVCDSDATTIQLKDVLPKQKDRIKRIHAGFDPSHWKKRFDTAALRKKLGLQNKFIVLGYGRPGTSKGFPYLIDAFPEIKKRVPNAVLLMILSKDKQYAQEIEEFKKRADSDVKFLDPQPYDKLPRFIQMANCVVVPSITEGFGYTTLESCAAGTPVVASNTTSIPEVISGKHVLVEPKSSRAIAKGVEKVYKKEFPWSRTVSLYEKEYNTLLQSFAKTMTKIRSIQRKIKRGA